jgi:hypothetical protein
MSRLVTKRAIKGKPIKRASTYTERAKVESIPDLIKILMIAGSNEKINATKDKAYKLLRLLHGLSRDEIEAKIKKNRLEMEQKGDIGKYFVGKQSAEEVAEKWKNEGATPTNVHELAMKLNKSEMPIKPTQKFDPYRGSYMHHTTTSEPLQLSSPVFYKVHDMVRKLKSGNITYKEFQNYMLDLAERRPEFIAHIAHILFTRDVDKFTFKPSFINRKTGKEVKGDEELKEKMLAAMTERQFMLHREPGAHIRNPLRDQWSEELKRRWINEEVMKNMRAPTKEEREEEANRINKDRKFGQDMYELPEGPLDRKKRRKKVIVKRKTRKVIRTPKKKCRCK